MKVFDVSYCQQSVDWPAVKSAGYDAMIAKCSEGLEKDSMFDSHMQGALSVGMFVGAYHYLNSLDAEGAKQEADFAAECCKPYPLTWPLYGDMEGDTMDGDIDNVIVAFCQIVESYGYKAGVYASLSNMRRFTWDLIKMWSTWVAQYNYDYCSFEHKVDLWQETEEGWINGIPRTVDLDVCYTDYSTGQATQRPISVDEPIAQPDGGPEKFSIAELQRTLNFLNFGNLEIDDNQGPQTEAVTRAAQSAYGLEVDGIAGNITWSKLSGQVTATQQRLCVLGYTVSVDGRLGAEGMETINAVKSFQRDRGISEDGIVGPITFALMFNAQEEAPHPSTPTVIPMPVATGDPHAQLTEHFNKWEFACECAFEGGPGYCDGFPTEISLNLVNALERVRQRVNFALNISSGVRCPQLNAEVGGVPDSQHMLGLAADVTVHSANGLSVDEFAYICEEEGMKTIRYYDLSFVHCQVEE